MRLSRGAPQSAVGALPPDLFCFLRGGRRRRRRAVRFLVVALFFRRRLAEQQALGYLRLFAVVEAHVPSHLSEALVQRAPGRSSLVLHPGNVSSLPSLRSDAAAPAAHGEMQSLAD